MDQMLRELVKMKVIRRDKDRYYHQSSDIYLPSYSPHSTAQHLGWRMRAVERSLLKEDIHYTNVFSVSKSDVENLRDLMVQTIEKQRKLVRESGMEAAAAFCCDFFVI